MLLPSPSSLQVQQLPPQLAQASITFKQFQDYAQLRRNVHMLAFALDFCTQVGTSGTTQHSLQRTTHTHTLAMSFETSTRAAAHAPLPRDPALLVGISVNHQRRACEWLYAYAQATHPI